MNDSAIMRSLRTTTRPVALSGLSGISNSVLSSELLSFKHELVDVTRSRAFATESRIAPEYLVCVIHECRDDVITSEPLIERRIGSCRCHHSCLDSVTRFVAKNANANLDDLGIGKSGV